MNDTDSRLNEALLPISHNGPNPTGNNPGNRPSTAFSSTTVRNSSQVAGYQPMNPNTYQPIAHTDSWGRAKKYCWWCAVIFTVVIIFTVVSLKLFLFKPIHKGPPQLDNSTAIEPNTKARFRLLMEGPRNRVQSLLGTSLWAYTVPIFPHPKIQVAAVGLYVERAEGKRRLRRFRGKEIDDPLFEDIEDILARGGMTESLRFVMASTPPSGRMLDWWDEYTAPIMQKLCPEIQEAEWKSFSDFFPEPFQKGDDFSFERREGLELYGYRKGQDRTQAVRIAGSCMAQALFEAQLEQQKKALVNLLNDFFER
jgi:hypothetical protein